MLKTVSFYSLPGEKRILLPYFFAGIDYFLSKRGEKYVPVGIEVNSHDCIRCCQRYEFINPSSAGKSVWPLVETMIERSQAFMLKRKTILVLGLGAICRKLVLEAVIEEKFKVIYFLLAHLS